MMSNKIGDLRVWWIPQIPGNPFTVDVPDVETAALVLKALADYDYFQYIERIKSDYASAGGLERYCGDAGDGLPAWEQWEDEETGETDPIEYIAEIDKQRKAETDLDTAEYEVYVDGEYYAGSSGPSDGALSSAMNCVRLYAADEYERIEVRKVTRTTVFSMTGRGGYR